MMKLYRNIFDFVAMLVLALIISFLLEPKAQAAVYCPPVIAAGGAASLGWAYPIAVMSGVAAVVLIATQVDPWTPIFGADGVFYQYPKK